MEFKNNGIVSNKVLNELDKFTLRFIKLLEKYADYVIVSGYVSIILGRSRASEDVDLLIPKLEQSKFTELFNFLLVNNYECANTSISNEAYKMLEDHAIRFFEKGKPIPNIEFKQISTDIQKYALKNRLKLIIKDEFLFISPLELQIAYKLSLMPDKGFEDISSDKDFEDAMHIYKTFNEKLNIEKLMYFINLLNVKKKWELLKNEANRN